MSQADFGVALMVFLVVSIFILYVWLVPYRLEIRKMRKWREADRKSQEAFSQEAKKMGIELLKKEDKNGNLYTLRKE